MKHMTDKGRYRAITVDAFDLSPYAGFPVRADRMRLLRCSRCGDELVTGEALERALDLIAAAVLAERERLSPARAVFLRKRMGLTQAELAARMGCDRQTVAKWETRGVPISKQNDLILRTLYLRYAFDDHLGTNVARWVAQIVETFDRVRELAPRRRPPPVIIKAAS